MRWVMILGLLIPGPVVAATVGGTVAVSTSMVVQADPSPSTQAVPAGDVTAAQGSGLPERAAPARTMRAYWHVFIAFAITWALLFGFALSIGKRFGALEEELRRLRQG